MKFLTTLCGSFLPVFVAGQTSSCDISSLLDANGNWGTHRIRLPLGRSYDNLQLSNKGKIAKTIGEFKHRNGGVFSG